MKHTRLILLSFALLGLGFAVSGCNGGSSRRSDGHSHSH